MKKLNRIDTQDVPFFVKKEEANPGNLYEWVFTFGLVNVMLCAYLLGRYPEYYGYWHVIKSIILLSNRMVTYTRAKQQFYLLDFCYVGNYYSVAYFVLAAAGVLSPSLLRQGFWVLFSFGAGPLAFSIFLLRNSFVLHSLNKTTDLFIHASPALLAWAMRWNHEKLAFDICGLDDCSPTYLELIFVPIGGYMTWWVLYSIWMMFCGLQMVDQGYDLVYTLIMRTNKVASAVISPFGSLGPMVYMAFHAGGCWLFCALSIVWWYNFWAHTALLVFLIFLAAHNGATLYVKKIFRKELLITKSAQDLGSEEELGLESA